MAKKNYAQELRKDDTCFGFYEGIIEKEPGCEESRELFRNCTDKVNAAVPGGENGELAIDINGEMGECILKTEEVFFNAGVRYGLKLAKQPVRVFVKTLKNKPVEPVRVVVATKPTK